MPRVRLANKTLGTNEVHSSQRVCLCEVTVYIYIYILFLCEQCLDLFEVCYCPLYDVSRFCSMMHSRIQKKYSEIRVIDDDLYNQPGLDGTIRDVMGALA